MSAHDHADNGDGRCFWCHDPFPCETAKLRAEILREAAAALGCTRQKLRDERWANETGRRAVMTGIRLSAETLRRMADTAEGETV